MSIWGKVIGGVAGLAIGGLWGAIIGAVAGHHVIDKRRTEAVGMDDMSAPKPAMTTRPILSPPPVELAHCAAAAYDNFTYSAQSVECLWVEKPDYAIMAFRGTALDGTALDTEDFVCFLRAIPWWDYRLGFVHAGFLTGLRGTILRQGIWPKIKNVLLGCQVPVFLTGHSKGGAEAVVCAAMMAVSGRPPDGLVTFGAPRAGFTHLASITGQISGFRFVRGMDFVPTVPGQIMRLYKHDREATKIGTPLNPLEDHSIEGYLRDIDYQRHGSPTKRSYPAKVLNPYRRAALDWITQYEDAPSVKIAVEKVKGLYQRAGSHVEAFRLRGCTPRVIIDPDVEDVVARFTWRLDDRTHLRPRAFTWNTHGLLPGFPEKLYLERLVTKAPQGKYVRFLNLNTLDCRRANLEVVMLRSDTFLHDRHLRDQWESREVMVQDVPQRRRLEGWRLWCEGFEPAEIARQLASNRRLIAADISFRHNFADALRRAKMEDSHQKALLGHADDSTTAKYGSGYTSKDLYDDITRVAYDLDLSHLYVEDEPWG